MKPTFESGLLATAFNICQYLKIRRSLAVAIFSFKADRLNKPLTAGVAYIYLDSDLI